jgi:hypothetical protein
MAMAARSGPAEIVTFGFGADTSGMSPPGELTPDAASTAVAIAAVKMVDFGAIVIAVFLSPKEPIGSLLLANHTKCVSNILSTIVTGFIATLPSSFRIQLCARSGKLMRMNCD